MELTKFMNMCMVYDGDKVLVQNRVKKDYRGITFPGGKVEQGESFTDAVIREIFEETGLTIKNPMLCGIKDWYEEEKRYAILFYKTNKFTGSLVSSDEGEVNWVKLSEMKDLKLASGMDKMLKVFLEEDISEHYIYEENNGWIHVLK